MSDYKQIKGAVIDTSSFDIDFDDIKKDIQEFKPGYVKGKFSYPNGFSYEFEITPEGTQIIPNWKLELQPDGKTLIPIKPE
ncbi:hypothetical protein [Helcococcus kunzii]|uniref:hypothetical protein n=1 Tax=Helcococcus kunzii TaxID=40091 RepID=UPI0024AD0BB1|nr:hypothetical protein [Helcococcus kunzii]